VVRTLFRSPRMTRLMEGRATVLIRNGHIDPNALERESLTREELLDAIHRQGFEELHTVRLCKLEPNGTFSVEAFEPSVTGQRHEEILARLDALQREVAALRAQPAGD